MMTKRIRARMGIERRPGPISGSAMFASLLSDYGENSTFTANRAYWPLGVGAALKMQMDRAATDERVGD